MRAGGSASPRTLVIGVVAAMLLLVGCGSGTEQGYVERPVEELYNEAMDDLLERDYVVAARGFDEVERQHPYSTWATRAQLMASYAHYEASQYDEAIIAARRFIELHPSHTDVAYGLYLIALSYYEQISDVDRDQKMTTLALQSLQDVVQRFPDSKYARDARLKIDLSEDHLAGKEMSVGRYYLIRKNYVSAINRFRRVIETYQTTSHTAEALHRLTEGYLALGILNEAQTAAAILGYNYPGSTWYQHSYALLNDIDLEPQVDEGSWINQMFKSIF